MTVVLRHLPSNFNINLNTVSYQCVNWVSRSQGNTYYRTECMYVKIGER